MQRGLAKDGEARHASCTALVDALASASAAVAAAPARSQSSKWIVAGVAAGAVVTRSVLAHALVVGNPARQRGWVCRCGAKLEVLDGRAICMCGKRYAVHNQCEEV